VAITLKESLTPTRTPPQPLPDPAATVARATPEALTHARRRLILERVLLAMIDAIPDSVLILNPQRQILAVNRRLQEMLPRAELETILGQRPGEALGCLFATEGAAGCGTGEHCLTCGAFVSIVASQQGNVQVVRECSLLLREGGGTALDLEVTATPASVDGQHLTVCVLKDIGDEKRRTILERVFFHDVLNTAGGLHGFASLLLEERELTPEQDREYKELLLELSSQLVDEIVHQRRLLAAERGEFRPDLRVVYLPLLLREVQALYASHEVAVGRILQVEAGPEGTILSDPAILRRILGNLVKNALEASGRGETVTLSVEARPEEVAFHVHNPGVIPPEVQLQLFKRSFSTKAACGRGIGTYSVKLFGEKYLKGKVSFTSSAQTGTTFTFTVPKHFPATPS
jgi:hypothetical protein